MARRHGALSTYRAGCRCEDCKKEKARASRAARARRRAALTEGLVSTDQAQKIVGGRRALDRLRRNGRVNPRAKYGATYWDAEELEAARLAEEAEREQAAREPCKEEGCNNRRHARGLCHRHYARLKRKEVPQDARKSRARQASRRLAQGEWVQPPLSSPYRFLARTCRRCGDLITTPDELLRKDAGPINPCSRCKAEWRSRYQKRRAETDEEYRRRRADWMRRSAVGYQRRQQQQTVEAASRKGYEWTGPELELLTRRDLTTRQIAEMTRRTYAAVAHARHRVRHDPKFARMAGERSQVADRAAP